jgi:catechol-2,3-dioxygenase
MHFEMRGVDEMRSERILPNDWDEFPASEFATKSPKQARTTITKRDVPQLIGVGHVGLSARDPAALAEFYRDVLGLQVVPVDASALGATAFLSSHPADITVDLALFANPAYQHTAFEVGSLADLRAFHQRVVGRGVPVKMALNHGVSLSFYFDDPEGHLIEVYWSTGLACHPRHGDLIDLTLPEEALRRDVAELAARAGAPCAAGGAESDGRW